MRPSPVSFAALVGLLATTLTVVTSHPAHPARYTPHCDTAGTGDTRTETRPVTDDFRTVALTTSADVVVRQGSPASITVSGENDDVTRTETVIQKGQLIIRWKDTGKKIDWNTSRRPPLKVTVVMPNIEALAIASSGDMQVEGKLTGNDLAVQLTGSGDLHVPALALKGQVSTTVVGSGDIHLAGSCARHSVRLTGSGDIKADNLKAESVTVKISGSGDVNVYATESLDASVSGSGDIRYAGSPKQVVKNISGSGSVAKL